MYRYTPINHLDPVIIAPTFASCSEKVTKREGVFTIKTNDYGEGWVKVDGKVKGFIDQGQLIR